ncbi:F-box and WD-40 domain protein 1/11 [Sporothrix schenckii 1099-18]|uniref:F-box and WD-40 domain protein 1/11 n=1 Tax=Sporothrix schenckii 1099-18 TaxID=1397361 RepID=A0A0F2LWP2_SPOSC|nr:F-box and WD-40 domain protein 1/11 [Sporothrix schenckii 1099-18]KJR81873.1 F-box and WD-40 domain protein 1/11 [Sporothrix schenckii 1099-18]
MAGLGSGNRTRKFARLSMDDFHHPAHGVRGVGVGEAGASSERFNRSQSLAMHMGGCAVEDGDDDHDDDAEAEAGHHASGSSSAPGKKAIKGMIRRASVSLHDFIQRRASFAGGKTASTADDAANPGSHFLPNRILRSSHAHSQSQSHAQGKLPVRLQPANTDARPTTSHNFSSWRRVRQAASFRHSRVFDSESSSAAGVSESGSANAYGETMAPESMDYAIRESCDLDGDYHRLAPTLSSSAPLPGGLSSMHGPPVFRSRPPIIPPNTGGAARAAAAAAIQTDILQVLQPKWLQQDEVGNDRESGIGIAITSTESDSADEANGQESYSALSCASGVAPQLDVAKVDFVGNLPMELAIMILSELDAAGLSAASRVSRAWFDAVRNQHIWRESFLREKTTTYATSGPVQPGVGLGVPPIRPSCDWRQIYRVKQELDRRWQEGKTRPVYLNGHSDSIYCLQFDEQKIITGSRDKTIRIWDMNTLACRLVIGPPEVVRDPKLLYDDDGQPAHYITTAYHTRSSNSMPAAVSFPMHHSASILCLQYDDRILVTGSSDSSCIVYSVKSGYRPIRRLLHHTAAVLDLCFDDRYIITCSKDVTICVWDRETGAMLKQLRGHSGPVNAVQMRGNTIVSCSGDFRVKLWNIETGKAIREFTGHTKGLACSQFSEDGRFVASAGNDRVIRIWDANTGECVREMKAHESLVRSLHIDSVSGRLVSASYDRDIKVFDMETGQQLLDFPQWHQSWVLSAKSDYRRIISTGQDPKILVMDFGAGIDGIDMLETADANAAICASTCATGDTTVATNEHMNWMPTVLDAPPPQAAHEAATAF